MNSEGVMEVVFVQRETWASAQFRMFDYLTLDEAMWMKLWIMDNIELRSSIFGRDPEEELVLDRARFMELIEMLARKRSIFNLISKKGFGLPVSEVNHIASMVLGHVWPGVGALTMCETDAQGGALSIVCDAGSISPVDD